MLNAFYTDVSREDGFVRARPRRFIIRMGRTVCNPLYIYKGGEPGRQEKAEKVVSLMEQIYTATTVSRQIEVARQLALENKDSAHYMWFEAVWSGHVGMWKALEDSGVLARSGMDDEKYEVDARRTVYDAVPEAREALVRTIMDEKLVDGTYFMFDAARMGFPDVIRFLFQAGASAVPKYQPWSEPLHAACFSGQLECVKMLVEEVGLDVNARSLEGGATPLIRAAVGGQANVVVWLLANGADVTIKEDEERGGYDALTFGTGRSTEVVRLLLQAGAEANADAIKAAAHHGDATALDLLLSKAGFSDPVETVVVSADGETASPEQLTQEHIDILLETLSRCGPGGSVAIAQRLVQLICLPSEPESVDEALADRIRKSLEPEIQCSAVFNGHEHLPNDHVELLDYLLSVHQILPSLDRNASDESRSRAVGLALQYAAEKNSMACARLLLSKYGALPDFLDPMDLITALCHAARMGNEDMIRLLVKEHGADIHQASGKLANGPTPLWAAIYEHHEEAARLLVELGGPVEDATEELFEQHTTPSTNVKRLWFSIRSDCRAPVLVHTEIDPCWDEREEETTMVGLLCLEFPDGYLPRLVRRKPDEQLKDEDRLDRPLRDPDQ